MRGAVIKTCFHRGGGDLTCSHKYCGRVFFSLVLYFSLRYLLSSLLFATIPSGQVDKKNAFALGSFQRLYGSCASVIS